MRWLLLIEDDPGGPRWGAVLAALVVANVAALAILWAIRH